MRKIVFITGSLSQPRVIKRIISIHSAGFEVSVYGFDKGQYNGNTLPQDISVEILGSLKDGKKYLTKIKKMRTAITEIIDKERSHNPIFYTFGFIGAYFINYKKVEFVYELSDLIYGYPKFNKVRFLLKLIEKKIIRNSSLTIMTSEGFRDFLFKTKIPPQVIIQPNKLSSYFKNKNRPVCSRFNINNLKFAFVGAIRYPETVLRFATVVGEKFPNHEFHFFGESIFSEQFIEKTREYKNVVFHGKFKNPDDLECIYSQIDIVVCVYHTDSLNERIAEPNKLYESIYFAKPIIVSQDTFLEKQVNKFNCGVSLNSYSNEVIEKFIKDLTSSQIKQFEFNELNVPTEQLIDDPRIIIERLSQFS